MTKRQGRLFFIICTLVSATVFVWLIARHLGLTVDGRHQALTAGSAKAEAVSARADA